MRKLTHFEIARRRLAPSDMSTVDRMPVISLLDNIRSLYNVGSIFRTADGAMLQELILTGFTPTPPRREIEKTALGATETVPWKYIRDPLEAITLYRDRGFSIVCLEQTDSSISYRSLTRENFPLILVVGNELTGISPGVVAQCDRALEIPMHGSKHSLNVAVAFGIAVFECRAILDGR